MFGENQKRNDSIDNSDLIADSRELLTSVVNATNMKNIEEMTPKKLAEAKVVLGFLNAANNMIKTKIQCFKLTGVKDKVAAIKGLKIK